MDRYSAWHGLDVAWLPPLDGKPKEFAYLPGYDRPLSSEPTDTFGTADMVIREDRSPSSPYHPFMHSPVALPSSPSPSSSLLSSSFFCDEPIPDDFPLDCETMKEMARHVLRLAECPMTTTEIYEKIHEMGRMDVKKNSLSGCLSHSPWFHLNRKAHTWTCDETS